MARSVRVAAFLSVVAVQAVNCAPALAQEATVPDATSNIENPAAQQDQSQLQEIIVTAQKRSESIQRVPISIVALTSETTEAYGIRDTQSLSAAVPGLIFARVVTAGTPFIRGVGHTNASVGDESPVAVYLDGFYLPAVTGNLFALNNIERVEVLKGPQGTLFGRNAAGGVVNIITRDPGQTPVLRGSLGYGNLDTYTADFYSAGPLSENLAADIALYYNNVSGGFGTNLFDGTTAYRSKDISARSKLVYSQDQTTAKLTVSYSRSKDNGASAGRVVRGRTGIDGSAYPGFYNVNQNAAPGISSVGFGDVEAYSTNLKLSHELDRVNLVSMSAYTYITSENRGDVDRTPRPVINSIVPGTTGTFTQEVQLISADDSKLTWILGLFYLDGYGKYDPLHVQGLAVPFQFIDTTSRQSTTSYAGFAQATFAVIDDTKITGGLRYTIDERSVKQSRVTNLGPLGAPFSGSATYKKLTYRAAVEHQFDRDIMGYVSYNRGFKSGFFNTLDFGAPSVKPETIDAFETGMKTTLLDNRLRFNVAAFYYDFKDIQVGKFIGTTTRITNAAKSKMKGIDVDFEFAPVRGLRFNGGLAYLNAKYKSFPGAARANPLPTGANQIVAFDASGNRMPQAPKWTASISAIYDWETDIGKFTAAATYTYNDGYFWEPENRLRQKPYNLVNASLAWREPSNHWGVRLWAKNVTKERYLLYASAAGTGDYEIPAFPRTFGVTVDFKY